MYTEDFNSIQNVLLSQKLNKTRAKLVKCLDSLELARRHVEFIILFFPFSVYLKYFTIKSISFHSHRSKDKWLPKANNKCLRNTQKIKRDRDGGGGRDDERDKRAGYGRDSPL